MPRKHLVTGQPRNPGTAFIAVTPAPRTAKRQKAHLAAQAGASGEIAPDPQDTHLSPARRAYKLGLAFGRACAQRVPMPPRGSRPDRVAAERVRRMPHALIIDAVGVAGAERVTQGLFLAQQRIDGVVTAGCDLPGTGAPTTASGAHYPLPDPMVALQAVTDSVTGPDTTEVEIERLRCVTAFDAGLAAGVELEVLSTQPTEIDWTRASLLFGQDSGLLHHPAPVRHAPIAGRTLSRRSKTPGRACPADGTTLRGVWRPEHDPAVSPREARVARQAAHSALSERLAVERDTLAAAERKASQRQLRGALLQLQARHGTLR